MGALQELSVFFGREHMTDSGDQDEVVILSQRIAQHVTDPCGDAVRKASFPDVFLGDRNDLAQVQNFRFQPRYGARESNGIRSRSAAQIQHTLDSVRPYRFYYRASPLFGVAVHGGNKSRHPILFATAGAGRGSDRSSDRGSGAHALGQRRPTMPQVNGVHKGAAGLVARALREETGAYRSVAKCAVFLVEQLQTDQNIQQHLCGS